MKDPVTGEMPVVKVLDSPRVEDKNVKKRSSQNARLHQACTNSPLWWKWKSFTQSSHQHQWQMLEDLAS